LTQVTRGGVRDNRLNGYPPELYDVDHLNAYYAPRYPHDLGAITSIQRHTDALTL